MTAEIAIMNRQAIALAADSAVTITVGVKEKIFSSANKLFALSKYQPVGIMVYGVSIFMGIPWETIIKTYRAKLGKRKFNTLKEYSSDFIDFLDGNPMFPVSMQEKVLKSSIHNYFYFIRNEVEGKIHSIIDKEGKIADQAIIEIIMSVIEDHYKRWTKADTVLSIPKNFGKVLFRKYLKDINEAIRAVFEKLPLSARLIKKLQEIAVSLFFKFPKDIETTTASGVVIAGFGAKETFPSLLSYQIETIVNNKLKYRKKHDSKIDFNHSSSIIPFAQQEMVYTFMEGIDPNLLEYMHGYLAEIFQKYPEIIVDNIKTSTNHEKKLLKEKLSKLSLKLFTDYINKAKTFRDKNYVDPITTVVSALPKDELATMAENLVNLTILKLKFTLESETVGGPIDVAVISKGDGFIWIKRKHYFKADLNPQFFETYYREV